MMIIACGLHGRCVGLLGPLQRLWAWQAARKAEPSSASKMAIGALLCALAYGALATGSLLLGVDTGAKAPLPLLALTMALLTVGELYLSPVGLSLISRCAAGAGTSTGLGLWFLATGIADVLGGWLSAAYPVWPSSAFFGLAATLAASSALLLSWLTEALQQAALAERTLLGLPVSPAASPHASPIAPRLQPLAGSPHKSQQLTVRIN